MHSRVVTSQINDGLLLCAGRIVRRGGFRVGFLCGRLGWPAPCVPYSLSIKCDRKVLIMVCPRRPETVAPSNMHAEIPVGARMPRASCEPGVEFSVQGSYDFPILVIGTNGLRERCGSLQKDRLETIQLVPISVPQVSVPIFSSGVSVTHGFSYSS